VKSVTLVITGTTNFTALPAESRTAFSVLADAARGRVLVRIAQLLVPLPETEPLMATGLPDISIPVSMLRACSLFTPGALFQDLGYDV
jgi:hypothetical protein